MKNLISKLLIFFIFLANSLHVVAGDTIKITTNGYPSYGIVATLGKQFTMCCVNTDIKQIFIGTGNYQSISFDGPVSLPHGTKEIIIEGEEGCEIIHFSSSYESSIDLSRCPSIESVTTDSRSLQSIILSNCVNLKRLFVSTDSRGGSLRNLDVSACKALEEILCAYQALSILDLSNNPAMQLISVSENHFPLSNLYAICEVVQDRNYRRLGKQTLGSRRVALGDTLDYSSQKEFGGAATNFWVLNGRVPLGYGYGTLAHPSEYNVNNGVITFHKAGWYTVDMRNPVIVSNVQNESVSPTCAILFVEAVDFVPATEITGVPASVSVGIQYILGPYRITVLPDNATYLRVTWTVTDAGTTGATVVGTSLRTTAPGTVKLTATVEYGIASREDYTQDFVIEITPLSIDEAAQGLEAIEVYPNPTTGELRMENGALNLIQGRIENVEVFDVYGRKVSSHHLITSSSNHLINISHLPVGTYFVKIMTEQGEVVRKVVKQ